MIPYPKSWGDAVKKDSIDKLLHKVPTSRRQVIKSLLVGAFVVPVVSSFPLDGRLGVNQAMAAPNSF